MSRLPLIVCLLAASEPISASAEVGAAVVSTSVEGLDTSPLLRAAQDALTERGFSAPVDPEAPAALSAALTRVPPLSEVARMALELGAELIAVAYIGEGEGERLSLHLSLLTVDDGRLVTVERLLERGALRAALVGEIERLSVDEPPPAPPPQPPPSDPHVGEGDEVTTLPTVDDDAPPPPERQPQSSGRAQLAINSTLLGLSLMTGVLFAADVQDPRLFAPILLVGGAAGLTTSLLIHRRWPVSRGDSAVIAAGGWYGAALGINVAGAAGYYDIRWLMTGGLIGEVVGLSAGIVAAAFTEASPGDGAVVHSSTVWGLFSGGVLAAMVWSDDPRASFGMVLAGLGVGLSVGGVLTRFVEISPGRAAVIDLYGLLGVLLGASVGIPIIVEDQSAGQLRTYAGILLGAAAAGVGLGVLLTRRWDERREESRSRRGRRGRDLSFAPSPTIIPPNPSIPGATATLGVQLVGGSW